MFMSISLTHVYESTSSPFNQKWNRNGLNYGQNFHIGFIMDRWEQNMKSHSKGMRSFISYKITLRVRNKVMVICKGN